MTDRNQDPRSLKDLDRESGQASGRPQGARQSTPTEAGELDTRIRDSDPDVRGLRSDDELRDKRGKGVAGEYDDSIGHDADRHYRGPGAAERPADPKR